jgi:hypothetical protein
LAIETVVVVAVLMVARAILWAAGVDGMSVSPLASSIVAGGIFVMGLLIAGTLSDYKDAERAPTDLAAGLYAILRESESMHEVWRKPDQTAMRKSLIAVVTTLRADINAGNSRTCQAAIEDLSQVFLEMENTDVPPNYIVRLRQEQAGLRKSLLRVYHIQHEQFLPSAYAMIVAMVLVILGLVMFTNFGGRIESLVTVGFLSFFFLALLRLLNIIDKPFKVGLERTDDDVSLFLLNEFVVQARASEAGVVVVDDVEELAVAVEERLVEVEEEATDVARAAEDATAALSPDD